MRYEVVPLMRSSMPLSLRGIEGGLDPAAPDQDASFSRWGIYDQRL